ncbi:hypothetical protein ACMD2_26547 [Ananas comosus]|uniref:Uncharacterized protein n=1 Tax=Ananas comosus TaxID=4615 RepID=A0A199VJA2_ANACO|nr:hypothetical protein ACMD2_26547 [Ananas comosus]
MGSGVEIGASGNPYSYNYPAIIYRSLYMSIVCSSFVHLYLIDCIMLVVDRAGLHISCISVDLGSRQHIDSFVVCFDLVDHSLALYALALGFGHGTGLFLPLLLYHIMFISVVLSPLVSGYYGFPSWLCRTHWETMVAVSHPPFPPGDMDEELKQTSEGIVGEEVAFVFGLVGDAKVGKPVLEAANLSAYDTSASKE